MIIRRTIITIIVLACMGGLAIAAQHTRRGDDEIQLTGGNTTVVELLTPPDGSTLVNQQAQVGIDLTTNYDANLVIDGKLIPTEQLERHPELNSVYFTPGPGKVFTALPPGRNTIQAIVFRVDKQPSSVPPITWTFNVS
jgi:hypothetical protein